MTVGRAVPSLIRWGVSADADLVYRCLASFGPRRAGEVAADLGLLVRRVRPALDELVAAGLVRSIRKPAYGADAAIWQAVPADTAVARLRRRAAATRAGDATVRCRPPYPARRLPDRDATRRRIAELMSAERAEHLAMNPEQEFSAAALAAASPLDVAVLARGVQVRALGRPAADGDRSAQHTAQLVRLGGEYREAARVPHKLMIFDRQVALLAVDPLDLSRGAWEVVDPAEVEALVHLFLRHWAGGTDPRESAAPDVVLTTRERAVVTLLAEGHTDVGAAQHLGMSVRSVTYTLRGLMDRLGVENRFQLGLALGMLHAVTPPWLTCADDGVRDAA
jgi:DNA-binding CsgD family transcriptional regulator